MDQQVYRVSIIIAFLKAGVLFMSLLENNGLRHTDRSHMSHLIPFILQKELAELKLEISDNSLSVIFDTTTRLGEVLVVVLRYLDAEWSIQQREG